MQRYEHYKDSGIEWLGEIPEHWDVKKGKRLFKKEARPINDDDQIITCFRDGQVTLRSNRRTDGFTNSLKEIGYQGIRKGDLVIHNMDAFAGAIGVSDSDGKSTPVYSACTPIDRSKVNAYYYSYLLRHLAINGLILALAKGIRERSTDFRFIDFGNLEYYLPPLSEQTAIAKFLDTKCEQIDRAVGQKERVIELLNERRQTVIQRAVTRGLNPDVPLRDSGIEWIGEIPKHWEVKKAKYVSKIRSGDPIVNNLISDSGKYEVYGGNGLIGYYDKFNVKGTNIIIGRVGALCGNVRLTTEPKFISDNALILTCINEAFYHYMYILLSAAKLNSLNTSNAQPLITGTKVMNISLPLPPPSEQTAIAKFLDTKCEQIDRAVALKREEVEKLKEYKQTLINSAVTGKIKIV